MKPIRTPHLPRLAGGVFSILAGGGWTAPAMAHVKWFNQDYCVDCRPDLADRVFDQWWWALCAVFALLSLCAFVIDRAWSEAADQKVQSVVASFKAPPEDYLRIGLGVFLLCLWVHSGILLTPELRTSSEVVPWFQLALAATTLSWRTTWIACCGVFVLYAMALAQYGFFHLLDYPIFLGIASYLAIHSLRIEALRPAAGSVLLVAVSGTLLWASFEKWAYWVWTMPVLGEHPDITLGFSPKSYVILAGFVEFFLAYFLLAGRFLGRLAAFALLIIFVSAVFDFGKIDAIGHLLIILSLVVIILQGKQPVTDLVTPPRLGITAGALASTGILAVVLGVYAVGYFGLHQLLYD